MLRWLSLLVFALIGLQACNKADGVGFGGGAGMHDSDEADADTAIALVQTNLNTEAAARATAVSAEAATRAAAVTSLQSQITNILSDATPQILDDLASIVQHFSTLDQTVTGNVASALVRIAAIEAAVNAALGQSLGP